MQEKKHNQELQELTRKAIEEAKKINEEYFYFNLITEDLALNLASKKEKKGKLSGIFVSVKDAINIKDVETTASSKILQGYKPLFDATVIERVKKEGAIIIGKTVHDEFGFGSFCTNVSIGRKIPLNPIDKERACGGSSGGCAGITKKTAFRHISLAESTGGSIICPASFCGVVGLCPTYGRVSRNGLIDYGNSLDKIGPISKNVYDAALMLEVIAGYDENDSTSSEKIPDKYTEYVNKSIEGMKIGLIKESLQKGVDQKIIEKINQAVSKLKKNGAVVEEVSLPIASKYSLAVYYMIATSESSTNLAKYCGMRYGIIEDPSEKSFNDYFTKIRSENFNAESKRRIILGTFARMAGFRDAYYLKAAKIRTKIINEYKDLFKKYDALLSPSMPITAPKFTEIEKMTPLQNYMMDILLVGPNLAGLPHITVPFGNDGKMPIGIMFIGDHFEEKKIIQLAGFIEKENRSV